MMQIKPKIEVELNIFSGRRNPRWELTEDEINELKNMIITDVKIEVPTVPPQLGYRGFAIINTNKGPGVPKIIYCYNGVITIMDKGISNNFEDKKRIEWWLVLKAREKGFGSPLLDKAFPNVGQNI